MVHCQVYAAAQHFRIEGLDSLAFERINYLLRDDWSSQQSFFCLILELIWFKGLDQGDQLQLLLLDLVRIHFEELFVFCNLSECLSRISGLMGDWGSFLRTLSR